MYNSGRLCCRTGAVLRAMMVMFFELPPRKLLCQPVDIGQQNVTSAQEPSLTYRRTG
jgi:hypothetical protein